MTLGNPIHLPQPTQKNKKKVKHSKTYNYNFPFLYLNALKEFMFEVNCSSINGYGSHFFLLKDHHHLENLNASLKTDFSIFLQI